MHYIMYWTIRLPTSTIQTAVPQQLSQTIQMLTLWNFYPETALKSAGSMILQYMLRSMTFIWQLHYYRYLSSSCITISFTDTLPETCQSADADYTPSGLSLKVLYIRTEVFLSSILFSRRNRWVSCRYLHELRQLSSASRFQYVH